MRFFRHIFLTYRVFTLFASIAALFIISFLVPQLFPLAQILLILGGALVVLDVVILFNPKLVMEGWRMAPKILSLGNQHKITIHLHNPNAFPLGVKVIDELPAQLQKRDFQIRLKMASHEKQELVYSLRPLSRGLYAFGKVNLFLRTVLGLVERKYPLPQDQEVSVYPSIVEMKSFELKSFAATGTLGIKRIRKLGHSFEFEQIKEYVRGDDYQSINWKATSRSSKIMVNHFQDEKSQQVYCLVDKSRAMKMPFNGLSLLEYAINTSLVIANTSLHKQDRAGLITFSHKIDSMIKPDRKRGQLRTIMEALYREKEGSLESNYELLYRTIQKTISVRSLLFLFSNFENIYALQRVLPILRKISKQHLLVFITFENTEIMDYSRQPAQDLERVYFKSIAQKFISDKNQIIQLLKQYKVQTVKSRPEELSLNTVNKYLELKARGLI